MNLPLQMQVRILKDKLKLESRRYTEVIREGDFTAAKAIKTRINNLEMEMDKLLPYMAQKN